MAKRCRESSRANSGNLANLEKIELDVAADMGKMLGIPVYSVLQIRVSPG